MKFERGPGHFLSHFVWKSTKTIKLLRIFDEIFDVIIGVPFLTLYKTSAIGPITGALNLEPYAKKFVESHERCDPLHDTTGKMNKKKAGEPMEEEHIHSTIF